MDIMKQFRMDGKKGFITGAAQGIGKAIAEAFIQAGAEFTIVDVNMEKAQAVAQAFSEQYGRHITAFHCDVSDPQQVAQMADMVTQTYGTIDFASTMWELYFFPSGIRAPGRLEACDRCEPPLAPSCARRLPQSDDRAKQPGTIVNMASMSALHPSTPHRPPPAIAPARPPWYTLRALWLWNLPNITSV